MRYRFPTLRHKTIPILLLALLLISVEAAAQPRILGQRCLGGSGEDAFPNITPTRDGGYIVLSLTTSSDGDVVGNHKEEYRDIWVIKFNARGEQEWSRCYGGSRNDEGGAIVEAPDNGYLIVGATASMDGDAEGWHKGVDGFNQMRPDAWAVRIDARGEVLWQRSLGGTGIDVFHGACRAHGGGYVLVGCTTSHDGDVQDQHTKEDGQGDAWAVKLSETGVMEWQSTLGGTNHEQFTTVAATPDGGYIAAGETGSNDGDVSGLHRDGTGISQDLWVVKLDGSGKLRWQRCLGGTGFDSPAFLQHILVTKNGNYVMLCRTNSKDGDVEPPGPEMLQTPDVGRGDTWIVRLNSDGSIQHQRRLGHQETDDMSGLVLLSNGDVIATGSTATQSPLIANGISHVDGWMVRLDSTLNVRWEARLGGSEIDELNDLIVLDDSTLVVAGSTRSNDGDVQGLHLKDGKPSWDLWLTTVAIEYIEPRELRTPAAQPSPGGSSLSRIGVTANPTRGQFTLVLPQRLQGDVLVEVTNTEGQRMLISSFADAGNRLPLDLDNFPRGTYTVSITRGSEKGVAEVTIER